MSSERLSSASLCAGVGCMGERSQQGDPQEPWGQKMNEVVRARESLVWQQCRCAPYSPAEPAMGKMEGLRRPCRCQPLCLFEPSPETAACPPLPSGGLPESRRWGQLDAFSRWGWLGFSGCLAPPGSEPLRLLAPF